jgi:hypothetical protein
MRTTSSIITVALCALAVSCGPDQGAGSGATDPARPATTGAVATSTAPTSTAASGEAGWIGGEPEWQGGEMAAGGGEAFDTDAGAPSIAVAEEAPAATPDDGGARDVAAGPLRAGSVDDNAAFDDYLAYRARIAELGIPLRGGDPTGRVVVSVADPAGRGVHGAVVTVTDADGNPVATMTTTADGAARFIPSMWSQPVDGTWTFTAGSASVTAAAGGTAAIAVPDAATAQGPVALDVLFLLDATGSMGDEIDQLKSSIDSVADRVAALEGSPDVRLAMTIYRDEGDAFVTGTYDFTSDVNAFRAALAEVVADGGGDYPEALDEAFDAALTEPAWRDPATTLQLIFLVADAPPHVERQVTGYDESIRSAVERGIKVFPVASSESDDQAEAVFRQIAQATGARFVFLSYGAGGAATGPSTDIDSTDYEELALDDLVVRLVAEEVAALTGDDAVVPPPTPTTTTVPPGQ